MAARISELQPHELRWRCDPDSLGFETTEDVPPLTGTTGQDRAMRSIEFGLRVETEGYHLFAAGPLGTGKETAVCSEVERLAAERPTPDDWCYVYNFTDPYRPRAIRLPAGQGRALQRDMDDLVEACRREISRAFDSEDYRQRREAALGEIEQRKDQLLSAVQEEARQRQLLVQVTPIGLVTVPLADGRPMAPEEFQQLPAETRAAIERASQEVQERVRAVLAEHRRLDKEAGERLERLDREVGLYAIGHLVDDVRGKYAEQQQVLEYLNQVRDDIVDNLDAFRLREQEREHGHSTSELRALEETQLAEGLRRYKVNVVVDNGRGRGAPVTRENNPTYHNLLGRIDYRARLGSMVTDHTMVKGGALVRANGGYLVVNARDVLTNALAWEGLKRALRSREVQIENLAEHLTIIPTATLRPEPIPLDVKVVLLGEPMLYYLLYHLDDDFRKLFKVKADFGVEMERSAEHVRDYAEFVSAHCKRANLLPLHKGAVARVLEYGARLAEHQRKLSTRFMEVADLASEASFWARRDGVGLVRAEHVDRAVEEKEYRSNLVEEKIHEMILEGTLSIATDGFAIGQVNGISIAALGDYAFGRPSRITARVAVGKGQMINIERECEMSGRIHNKAFLILSGYLAGRYAREAPLSLSASIAFEQQYDEVEGDSASCAELFALLSALAEVPLRQNIAVTGAVNQHGEVLAVGGVTRKIEGFFAVCKERGLTGEQGVLLPASNVKHLMLRDEVVGAVDAGKFHLWPVQTVDQAIELLTGVPAGERAPGRGYPADSMNGRVERRLKEMAEGLKRYAHALEAPEAPAKRRQMGR